jgi:hypothetical protein
LYTRYCFDIGEKPSISALLSGTIFNCNPLCKLDMYSISKFLFDIKPEYYIVLQYRPYYYRDITISKVKTLMSYMISVQYWDIRISTFSLRYQRFGRYRVRYVIPWAAGRTGHVLASPIGPTSWSSTRLDGLLLGGWTPFPAGRPFLLEFSSCFRLQQWPGLGMDCRPVTVGRPHFKLP